MKQNVISKVLEDHRKTITIAVVCAGVIGMAAIAYGASGYYTPLSGDRGLLVNDVVYPGSGQANSDSKDSNEDDNLWDNKEESVDDRLSQDGSSSEQIFNNSIKTTDVANANALVAAEGSTNAAAQGNIISGEKGTKVVLDINSPTVNPQINVVPDVHSDERYQPAKPSVHPKQNEFTDTLDDNIADIDISSPDTKVSILAESANSKKWDDNFSTNQLLSFCVGDNITDEDILYAFQVEIEIRQSNDYPRRYLASSLKHIKVERQPGDNPDKDLLVKFTADINGTKVESEELNIHLYDQRIIYADENGNPLLTEYADNGKVLHLNQAVDYPFYSSGILSKSEYVEEYEANIFTKLLQGWSETPNGKLVDYDYKVNSSGKDDTLKVLYARTIDVPEGLVIQDDSVFVMPDDGEELGSAIEMPTLIATKNIRVADVPEGVRAIKGDINVDTLIIPSTVDDVDLSEATINKGFEVNKDNDKYSTFAGDDKLPKNDGMLLDTSNSLLYAVASNQNAVTIPSSVTDIKANFRKGQTVRLTSAKAPRYTMRANDNEVNFVIPDESYVDYLRIWKPDDEAIASFTTDDGRTFEDTHIDIDGAVIQELPDGGKALLAIPESLKTEGVYVIPDDITEIAAGAIPSDSSVGALIIPASVKKVDASLLDYDNVSAVYFLHDGEKNPMPEITNADKVDKYTYIYVESEGTMDALGIPEDQKVNTSLNNGSVIVYKGNVYDAQEDGFISLRRANTSATTFDESDVPEGYTLQNIFAGAFSNCKNLKYVELPESTTMILNNAFDGCSNLEGVWAQGTEMLYLFAPSFEGCDKLKFFASNSEEFYSIGDEKDNPDLEKEFTSSIGEHVKVLRPAIGENEMHNRYWVEPQGDGYILYDIVTDKDGVVQTRAVVSATSEVSGEINLVADDGDTIDAIWTLAFADCGNEFTISLDD